MVELVDDEMYIVNVSAKVVHRQKGLTENCNTDDIKTKIVMSGKRVKETIEQIDTCEWCI